MQLDDHVGDVDLQAVIKEQDANHVHIVQDTTNTHTHAVVKERRALIQRPIASDGESPNKRVVHVVRQRMDVGINQDTGHVANQLAIVARNLVMANNGCCFSEW